MTYAEKLKSPQWQRKRLAIMQRDNFTCVDCGATQKTLHVHHCFYERGDPWDTDDSFLLTVCSDCHSVRGKLEEDGRHFLGLIFQQMRQCGGIGELRDMVSSMGDASRHINEGQYCVMDQIEVDMWSSGRWFQYACSHPKFRSAYEAVTCHDVDWASMDARRKHVK